MQKQLQKMWGIEQQDNESKTQQEFPIVISEATKLKMKLLKLGTPQEQQREGQLDLDQYLQTQRANNKARIPKPKPKTAEEIQKQKQFKEGYGKGFKMLQKMGFNIGKGLGKNQQGRTNIIEAQFKTSLTARDQQYEEELQKQRLKQEKQEKQKQEVNPYNQLQFQQLFQYKSKIPTVNSLLLSLKNKYEVFKSKLDLLNKEADSFERDMQISQSLKMQKKNQIKITDQQIKGLQEIQKSASNIQKYPHLGLAYNADLLIIKQSIDILLPLSLQEVRLMLQSQLSKTKYTLTALYLAKQKQTLKQYNQTTGFELRMKGYFKKNKKDNIGEIKANKQLYGQEIREEQIKTISVQDTQKISKYIKLIIEEGVVVNKLDNYLSRLKDISKCQQFVIDLMEIVQNFNKSIIQDIKSKYLVPLANRYLLSYKYHNERKLPHLQIFPWMMILKIEELQINGFILNICSNLWSIENDSLYSIVYPWLKYITTNDRQYFINFFLAPRILYEMEELDLTSATGNQKQKIKGFIKYCELLPSKLRLQIVQNSLALSLLHQYKNYQEENSLRQEDLKNWILKWIQRVDKLGGGAIKKVFLQNNISDIW